MRAVASRVIRASVTMRDGMHAGATRAIGPGLLVLLGIGENDAGEHAQKLVGKLLALRIFANEAGKFDLSVLAARGEILLVPQFTLYGSLQGGRRPDFTGAARPEKAEPLCRRAAELLAGSGLVVRTGEFGASMAVESVNDGPVTLWLDTELF